VFLSTRILVFAARPGRIHADVRVPFPYPRDASLRASPDYHALVGNVLTTLRQVEDRAA
jgi:ABC-type nitrate/sulfonate/bicarbonate transport system ATPase subunit